MGADELMQASHERHLTYRRQRGFRLVEQVQPIAAKSVLDEREEGLSMRLLVQCAWSKRRGDLRPEGILVEPLDLRRHVVVALRSKKEAVAKAGDIADQSQIRV